MSTAKAVNSEIASLEHSLHSSTEFCNSDFTLNTGECKNITTPIINNNTSPNVREVQINKSQAPTSSSKRRIVEFWRQTSGAPCSFLPLGLTSSERCGNNNNNNNNKSSQMNSSMSSKKCSSQPQEESSVNEFSLSKQHGDDVGFSYCEDEEYRNPMDASNIDSKTINILRMRTNFLILLQLMFEKSLQSRYFHTWWRSLLQNRLHQVINNQNIIGITGGGGGGGEEGTPLSLDPLVNNINNNNDITTTIVPHISSQIPSRVSHSQRHSRQGILNSTSLDMSWHMLNCDESNNNNNNNNPAVNSAAYTNARGEIISGVLFPRRSNSFSTIDIETQSQPSPGSLSAAANDISDGISEYFLRRQGRSPPMLQSPMTVSINNNNIYNIYSSNNNSNRASGRSSRQGLSARSQEMVLVFYCGVIEEEENNARELIKKEEYNLRRQIQKHGRKLLDKIIMMALCGGKPTLVNAHLCPRNLKKKHINDINLSSQSTESLDKIPSVRHTKRTMPSVSPDIPHRTEEEELEIKSASITSEEGSPSLHPSIHNNNNNNNNKDIKKNLTAVWTPLTSATRFSETLSPNELPPNPSLMSTEKVQENDTEVNIVTNNNNNIPTKTLEAKEEECKKQQEESKQEEEIQKPLNLLSGIKYMELRERERERRCRVIEKYRQGLERIIYICFGDFKKS